MSLLSEYLHVMGDPAHVAAEATFVTIEIMLARPLVNRWVKRHDKKHHPDLQGFDADEVEAILKHSKRHYVETSDEDLDFAEDALAVWEDRDDGR